MDRPRLVVNADDVAWKEQSHGERFGWKRKQLGAPAGGEQLGCSLYELPAGKRSFPYHFHTANEEAIYVLEGAGTLRLGGKEVPLRAGDYAALLASPEGAHQVINTSAAVLRYLCFSTMRSPDVAIYPDSNKIGVFAGTAPGGPPEKRVFSGCLKADAKVDYWDGEN